MSRTGTLQKTIDTVGNAEVSVTRDGISGKGIGVVVIAVLLVQVINISVQKKAHHHILPMLRKFFPFLPKSRRKR